jgi:hypothetical protein
MNLITASLSSATAPFIEARSDVHSIVGEAELFAFPQVKTDDRWRGCKDSTPNHEFKDACSAIVKAQIWST